MDEKCENEHCGSCSGHLPTPSVHQTLDELDFSRGIWSAAVDGCIDDLVEFLVRKHVHPDQTDSSGYTALHYACRNGHIEITKILLAHDASPNIQTRSGGVTPLHRAAYCGHIDTVKLLLLHKADPLISDFDGKLPLHKAAEKGHEFIVELLLNASPISKTYRDKRSQLPVDCVPDNSTKLRSLLEVNSSFVKQSSESDQNG